MGKSLRHRKEAPSRDCGRNSYSILYSDRRGPARRPASPSFPVAGLWGNSSDFSLCFTLQALHVIIHSKFPAPTGTSPHMSLWTLAIILYWISYLCALQSTAYPAQLLECIVMALLDWLKWMDEANCWFIFQRKMSPSWEWEIFERRGNLKGLMQFNEWRYPWHTCRVNLKYFLRSSFRQHTDRSVTHGT